jgi:hypothetical protein
LISLFALALGMIAAKELGLYLLNWLSSIFSPPKTPRPLLDAKTFDTGLGLPAKTSSLNFAFQDEPHTAFESGSPSATSWLFNSKTTPN